MAPNILTGVNSKQIKEKKNTNRKLKEQPRIHTIYGVCQTFVLDQHSPTFLFTELWSLNGLFHCAPKAKKKKISAVASIK